MHHASISLHLLVCLLGKLGMGDCSDRAEPCLIPRFKGRAILQVVAATWHSLALVAHPPMLRYLTSLNILCLRNHPAMRVQWWLDLLLGLGISRATGTGQHGSIIVADALGVFYQGIIFFFFSSLRPCSSYTFETNIYIAALTFSSR